MDFANCSRFAARAGFGDTRSPAGADEMQGTGKGLAI